MNNTNPIYNSCFRSLKYTFAIHINNTPYKIFNFFYHKNSFFIDFPYFKKSNGIVSILTIPPQISCPANLSMLELGKVTSHLVKFSYPPDGNAHFSQDGKVYSFFGNEKAFPIDKIAGHLFTIKIQGYNYFKVLSEKDKRSNRLVLNFDFVNKFPEAIQITGLFHPFNNLKLENGNPSGIMKIDNDHYFICSSPNGHIYENKALLLNAKEIKKVTNDDEASLTFMGGFNETVLDKNLETKVLVFSYPEKGLDELSKKIGNIDFIKNV